jgi:hypothetical protein
MVKTLRDQFLAGAALADDEHGTVEGRCTARALDCVEEGEALPDELVRALRHLTRSQIPADSWWQIPPIGKDFRSVSRPEIALSAELRPSARTGTVLV